MRLKTKFVNFPEFLFIVLERPSEHPTDFEERVYDFYKLGPENAEPIWYDLISVISQDPVSLAYHGFVKRTVEEEAKWFMVSGKEAGIEVGYSEVREVG